MKRFTGHQEPWGKFVYVKINSAELISDKLDKYKDTNIVIGSVKDSYQKQEKISKITNKILKK